MSYKPSRRGHSQHEETELNLLPMMNMFIIIISFLMTTAIFAKTALIDVYLPQEGSGGGTGSGGQAAYAPPAILTVSTTEKGFELGGIGGGRFIPKKGGNLDYSQLTADLLMLKQSYPDKEDAILLFPPEMSYDIVVKVMDASRETEERPKQTLFPLASLGEVK
ncbi:MAG: biopolymer transporter ExbD [Deltaproteobacteria bacterium]